MSNELPVLFHKIIALKQLAPLFTIEISTQQFPYLVQSFFCELKLLNVSCHALKNASLHVPAGSFVALTGETGAGKSTIFRLLLGLETNYTGTILFDNLNIRDFNLDALRKHFGVVLQTSTLFPGTIYSNICANTKISLDDAWHLAKMVGLDDEINAMPMKMFTYISDNAGDSISGGQRQKIMIARALANKPKILFLDEATSALDEEAQALIFNNLRSFNFTCFYITHRLSTLMYADQVYRLEQGRVIIVNKDEVLKWKSKNFYN